MDTYEKKYKEALEWARKVMQGKIGFVLDEVLEKFPELKESEDERIRKGLISFFTERAKYTEDSTFNGLSSKDILAWLEKQGEHANFINKIQIGDKVTRNEDGVLVNLSQLNRVAKKYEKQGEQKPAENKGMNIVEEDMTPFQKKVFSIIDTAIEEEQGLKHVCDELLRLAHDDIMQKPAWSEEDKKFINEIEESLLAYKIIVMDNDRELANYIEKEINWLKSLKGRVQPKQEWGEGDERYFNIVSSVIGSPSVQGIYDYHKVNPTDVSDWLREHIQPQKQWKPSEEQMKALNSVILKGELSYVNQGKELISLYNDLKRF